MDGSTLNIKKKFKEYRIHTEALIQEFENTLNEFEKNTDVKELSSKLKGSIERFQKETL